MELKGSVRAARVSRLRFPVSGKLAKVKIKEGSRVKKGQLLASLDKTQLQAYLDRALKQYEKERADFDAQQKESLTEFEKKKIQNELDISVKNVEIAKVNLDEAELHATLNGVVAKIDLGLAGENISPAKFVITLIDPQSFFFQAEVEEEKLALVSEGQEVEITLKAFEGKTFKGKVVRIGIFPLKASTYPVEINLEDKSGLRIGLSGKARF